MATSDTDYYDTSFRRVPMNSATTQKDYIDHNSTFTSSTYNMWPGTLKRTMTTTYIDGTSMLGYNNRSYNMKDLFPKGKSLQRPLNSSEKKMNGRNAYMSLLPVDESTVRSVKVRSPLSMATGKQCSSLPEVTNKSANNRNKRFPSAIVLDENSESKFYARCATTNVSGAWARRYKSINTSQIFSDLLRDPAYTDKIILKKRSYQQLLACSASSSSFTCSLIKHTIESNGTNSQIQINDDSYGTETEGGEEEEEEYHELDMTGRIIADNYRIGSKLGAGSFGQVYLCQHIHTHEQWAMKIESHMMNNNPQLSIEHRIYTKLQGGKGFPKIEYYGSEGIYDILIIELLGPSLEDLFNYCNRKFTLKTALMLVDQMISRIEYVHTCHLIHRDIKPDNFLMGIKSMGNTVYIIDFGLSKRYRDPKSFVHIPWKNNKSLTGTARYASINAHKGSEQSRRDDLEAISYVFMYFIMGTLPWQGLQATGRKSKFERIAEMKMKITSEQICKNYPKECFLFLDYCRTLIFDNRPDYNYLRYLFRYLLYQKGDQYDYEYDWIIIYRNKQLLSTINPIENENSQQ
ncbi:unnamed protein product [Rotaria sordida]|uniref:non-specific serine/threonine protein kinase n=1 Tax=Rotaria sordida TaxID=392033 RepID=A0A814Z0A5_9BILA|nr:unnamed protein product [Rotaria sordida]CAF1237131.1 unnamed protein product [Rotaria sordida]